MSFYDDGEDNMEYQAITSKFSAFMELLEAFRRSTELSWGSTYITVYKYAQKFGVNIRGTLPRKIVKKTIGHMEYTLPTKAQLHSAIRNEYMNNQHVWYMYRPYLDTSLPDRKQLPKLPEGIKNDLKEGGLARLCNTVNASPAVCKVINHQETIGKVAQKAWMKQKKEHRLIYLLKYLSWTASTQIALF